MLAPLAVLALAQAPASAPFSVPSPECRVMSGQQVCGYACVSTASDLRCARTPQGLCRVIDAVIICWDPPEEVRLHLTPDLPAPTCLAQFGLRACGWACVASSAQVACAQSPWGKCTTAYGRVACWDPPDALIHLGGEELATASCVSTQGAAACGWDCKTSFGKVACAQTPAGRCSAHQGRVECMDSPMPLVTHASR